MSTPVAHPIMSATIFCTCRTAAERNDRSIKLAADEVVGAIVQAIKLECPLAFAGLLEWQQSLVANVPNSCVSVATISADYQSPQHRDRKNVVLNALMSATAWFAQGTDGSLACRGTRIHGMTPPGSIVSA